MLQATLLDMVEITPSAVAEIERLKLNRQSKDSSLRLKVVSGGCSDLYYNLNFEPESSFTQHNSPPDRMRMLTINGVELWIDNESWPYIEHLKLDYSEDLMGGGFRFYNPHLNNICGCGISFAQLDHKST